MLPAVILMQRLNSSHPESYFGGPRNFLVPRNYGFFFEVMVLWHFSSSLASLGGAMGGGPPLVPTERLAEAGQAPSDTFASSGRLGLGGLGLCLGWLGLALAWFWLDSWIWAGFGLASAGFNFWLSSTRIMLGFVLSWLDFDWIWLDLRISY